MRVVLHACLLQVKCTRMSVNVQGRGQPPVSSLGSHASYSEAGIALTPGTWRLGLAGWAVNPHEDSPVSASPGLGLQACGCSYVSPGGQTQARAVCMA